MTRPEGGEGDGEKNAKESTKEGFDDVWGALVDSASPKRDAPGATKAWTEEVRAELKREPAPVEEEAPVGPSVTKMWTEEARAERKREVPPSVVVSSSVLLGPDPERLRAAAEDTMARLMRAEVLPQPDEAAEVRENAKAEREDANANANAEREDATADEREAEREDANDVDEVEARPIEIPYASELDDAPAPKRTGLWIAGIAALLVVGWVAFGRGDAGPEEAPPVATTAKSELETKRSPKREALASAQRPDAPADDPDAAARDPEDDPPTKRDASPAEAKDEAPELPATPDASPTKVSADTPVVPTADPDDDDDDDEPSRASGRVPELKRDGDPRQVPPDTAPANAAAFAKLAVGPGDRAPLGGIGRNGVHVDRIAVGSTVDKARCAGEGETFSASRHDVVNVCVRVVHARQKEDLVVLWQKDGGTVRRGKFVVPAVHAYRTRAYLVMRKEYVGKWTVRIQDLDGTELASHPFVVVE